MKLGKTKSGHLPKAVLSAVAAVLLVFLAQGIFLAGSMPFIEIQTGVKAIGRQTPFQVEVAESRRGLTYVKAELVQGDRSAALIEKSYPESSQFLPWESGQTADTLSGSAGTQNLPELKEGTAQIRVTVRRAATWLRHPAPRIYEISLPVRLRPPSLEITSTRMYVTRGGCELVTYRIGATAVRDGVQAGPWWFPGYPLPGKDGQDRFALFAAPYDMQDPDIRLVVADDAGNTMEKDFIDAFHDRTFKADTLDITDAFIGRVVPDILAQSPEIEDRGNPLDNYIAVNRELRLKNAATLKSLAGKSKPAFLWTKPFLMLPNGKVMATFGDRRTYRYQGATIDTQTHLGYDLASVRKAEVPAANDGIVVFAGFLGIYGNAVIIDHGYGLMTIYGHLSSIAVSEGQQVARGSTIGRTGTTGLAGGDHLHYGTLLQGLPVNPIEWSDSHWIRDRIAKKLGVAAPFTE
jgi:murein DD-endopeptidase MepM/ murein hydrolase activator NlpD